MGTARDQPPPLVWIGSPQVAEGSLADGRLHPSGGADSLPVALAPQLASNRSYFNASSAAFFAQGEVKTRGAWQGERFVARTLWPKRYAIGTAGASEPMLGGKPGDGKSSGEASSGGRSSGGKSSGGASSGGESIERLVRAEQGGARSAFASRTLWRRWTCRRWMPRHWTCRRRVCRRT